MAILTLRSQNSVPVIRFIRDASGSKGFHGKCYAKDREPT
jgi:hypothetical protein